MPFPVRLTTSSSLLLSISLSFAASSIDFPIGCVANASPYAASSISSSSDTPSAGTSFDTLNSPFVSVPVLSKTIVSRLAAASRKLLPFTRTPTLDAAPMPPKNPSGTEITSAHGQDTIRKLQALSIPSDHDKPNTRGMATAKSAAPIVTIGVYTRANLVTKFSRTAFLALAFSTSSKIFATVESSYSLVTLTLSIPSPFTHPDMISSPSETLLGTDSPVRADVSIKDSPSITTPSSGTLSPGLTTTILPISTSSGSTSSVSSPLSTKADSGAIAIISVIEALDCPTA